MASNHDGYLSLPVSEVICLIKLISVAVFLCMDPSSAFDHYATLDFISLRVHMHSCLGQHRTALGEIFEGKGRNASPLRSVRVTQSLKKHSRSIYHLQTQVSHTFTYIVFLNLVVLKQRNDTIMNKES